jgi:hypothetical protein
MLHIDTERRNRCAGEVDGENMLTNSDDAIVKGNGNVYTWGVGRLRGNGNEEAQSTSIPQAVEELKKYVFWLIKKKKKILIKERNRLFIINPFFFCIPFFTI